MEPRDSKQVRDAIEILNDRVFREYSEHQLIEPIVAILVRDPQGEFRIRFMEITSTYILEGRQGGKGWHTLQRRMMRMVAHEGRDGAKVLLLYHASVADERSDERIVIVTRTGADLEHVRERHYLPECGSMSVDGTGSLKIGNPLFKEL